MLLYNSYTAYILCPQAERVSPAGRLTSLKKDAVGI